MENKTKFNDNGMIAPVFTPFDSKGRLNVEPIGRYAEYLVSQGIRGVFVSGTSGEGLLMSVEERKQLLEAWMPYQSNLKIIAHIATTNYVESSSLARHAGDLGVDAISCMGPCYLPPKDVEELIGFNSIVASSAPKVPYYYYHLPPVSGVHLKMSEFLKVAGPRIPNLKGIKFTSPDIMDMQECISMENQKYTILHGHDGLFLNGLVAGASGGIGTAYNLVPNVFHKIVGAYESGDLNTARENQLLIIEYLKVMHKYVNSVVSTKAMLNSLGLELGPCRLPLKNLSATEIKNLEKDVKELDFFTANKL